MADFTASKTEYIRQLCRKLKPILGDKMSQVFEAYCAEDDNVAKVNTSNLLVRHFSSRSR